LASGTAWPRRNTPKPAAWWNASTAGSKGCCNHTISARAKSRETAVNRYVLLCSQQLSQPTLVSKKPLQAMKDWHQPKPDLFRTKPSDLPGWGG
jgi:hypothetical protein